MINIKYYPNIDNGLNRYETRQESNLFLFQYEMSNLPIKLIEMEVAIATYFGVRSNIIIPNVSWGLDIHECDLLIIRPSGLAIEVEIKRYKQDLINDFKKQHHHNSSKIKQLYYAIPEDNYEKWRIYIPEIAGIITVGRLGSSNSWVKIKRKAPINHSRNLSDEEIKKASQLGCMRIWKLKRKIITLQQEIYRLKEDHPALIRTNHPLNSVN